MSASLSIDQAQGLRRLFEGRGVPVLAVVSNPAVAWSGFLLEHLSEALGSAGRQILLVDASETAPEPGEWTLLDPRWAVDQRCEQFAYLGARGLIHHHLSSARRAGGLLHTLIEAAPWADVVLLHAPATDLMRLLAGQDWRPIVLADTTPAGVMQAYAALKVLGRNRLSTFDLLLDASAHPVLGPRLAMRLADSASRFLSWPVGVAVVVGSPAGSDLNEQSRLHDLVRAQWVQAPTGAVRTSCPVSMTH